MEKVIGLECRKIAEGKIIKALVGHCQNCDSYCEWDGGPREDSKQRRDVISFLHFRAHWGC